MRVFLLRKLIKGNSISDETLAHFVFASNSDSSLFTANAMKAMCQMEEELVWSYYGKTCPLHSIGFYTAILHNKVCKDITEKDVQGMLKILQDCSKYYYMKQLSVDCKKESCSAPGQCIKHNAVYKIMHYMVDKGFLPINQTDNPRLENAISFFGQEHENFIEYYTKKLEKSNMKNDFVEIAGIYFPRGKALAFDRFVVEDMFYFVIAGVVILVMMLLYLQSLTLVMATFLNIIFSFSFSYFLYFVIFRFKFFPFLNLITFILLIAIGADDVFIIHDTWKQTQFESQGHLVTHIDLTLKHAIGSIFVTSFTTAVAFLASIVSSLPSMRCFAVFTFTAVLINFILMATWIPAVIILLSKLENECNWSIKGLDSCRKTIGNVITKFYTRILPSVVINLKFLWMILFLGTGIGSIAIIFIAPKLQLPTTPALQLFPLSHPLEAYEFDLKDKFHFSDSSDTYKFQLWIVWGIKGEDKGSWVDPNDTTPLTYDAQFYLHNDKGADWLLDFCHSLKNQTFFHNDDKQRPCFFDGYKAVLEDACTSMLALPTLKPCCQLQSNPGDKSLFEKCLPLAALLSAQANGTEKPSLDSPIFDAEGKLKAYILSFKSSQPHVTSFHSMDKNYRNVDRFLEKQGITAPEGLKKAWFSGDFLFYDIQLSLLSGTYIALGVSLSFAFLMMVMTTLNMLLSIYAIITIAFAMFVTIAVFVLLGWELNILESLAISICAGMSVDFVIHYGVAYKQAYSKDRNYRVCKALERVGSAVTMAAATTFISGSLILTTRIHVYFQAGILFMVIMTSSYLFSTFFFLSICSVIGPKGSTCQIPAIGQWCKKSIAATNQNNTKFGDQSRDGLKSHNIDYHQFSRKRHLNSHTPSDNTPSYQHLQSFPKIGRNFNNHPGLPKYSEKTGVSNRHLHGYVGYDFLNIQYQNNWIDRKHYYKNNDILRPLENKYSKS